jgi:branched-chain amino acid transport system substrate-binding protein
VIVDKVTVAKLLAVAVLVVGLGARIDAAPEGPPVEIPVIVQLTGPAALLGQIQVPTLQLLEKQVNASGGIHGRALHFTFSDDQSNPVIALQLANLAINSHTANVILGGGLAATCRASIPLFASNGPVFYCMTPAATPPKGSYVFTSCISARDSFMTSIRFFHHMGWNKIAVINSTDASGAEVDAITDAFLAEPENRGIQLVAHEHFAPTDVSIDAQAAKIKGSGAQAIVMWGVSPALATAFRSFKDVGLDVPVSASPIMQLYTALAQYATILPSHLYFASTAWASYPNVRKGPLRDVLDTYFGAFKAMGVTPDSGQTTAWDPGLIVVDALRHLPPDPSATQIRDYIENINGFYGVNGRYDFRTGDQRGLTAANIEMVEWQPAVKGWTPVWTQSGAQ